MKRFWGMIIFMALVWGQVSAFGAVPANAKLRSRNGWPAAFDLLRDRLKKDKVPASHILLLDRVKPAYAGDAVFEKMYDIVRPTDEKSGYVIRDSAVSKASDFVMSHLDTFVEVSTETDVSPYVIASILWVETNYGNNVGNNRAIDVLVSLAALSVKDFGEGVGERVQWAAKQRSRRRVAKGLSKTRWHRINWPRRGVKIGERWLKELKAYLKIGVQLGWKIDTLPSSWAGALGYPQVMPTTLLWTLEKTGAKSMNVWSWDDTVKFVAFYLKANGWKKTATPERKKKAVFAYNNENAYGVAVFEMAKKLKVQVAREAQKTKRLLVFPAI